MLELQGKGRQNVENLRKLLQGFYDTPLSVSRVETFSS